MNGLRSNTLGVLALAAVALVTGCERPPVESIQRGYRGTGMVQIFNPRTQAVVLDRNVAPEPTPAVPPGGPLAVSVYKNVKVLTDLDVGAFTRLMVAMTAWVSPEQGCTYCHAESNFESDDVYAKTVARRMLQMSRHINQDWQNHVGQTGVTCYTCHRGQPVPAYVWFANPGPPQAAGLTRGRAGQNAPAASVGLTSLPYDPFTPYLLEKRPIRVQMAGALPDPKSAGGIMHAEWTYGLMHHFSAVVGRSAAACHRLLWNRHGARPQRKLPDAAESHLSRPAPWATGRRTEGQLRDLSPGPVQAAERVSDAEGLSGTRESRTARYGHPDPRACRSRRYGHHLFCGGLV
jgi:photosynthetic reaction center cytochrome c subunit